MVGSFARLILASSPFRFRCALEASTWPQDGPREAQAEPHRGPRLAQESPEIGNLVNIFWEINALASSPFRFRSALEAPR
eukprot:5968685-Pyramimonas_sp.AAC.1